MAMPPSEPRAENHRDDFQRRPVVFYPRYSSIPGTSLVSPFEANLIDVTSYRALTVEISDSGDLMTWGDLGATPPTPEGGPDVEGPADEQPPESEEA